MEITIIHETKNLKTGKVHTFSDDAWKRKKGNGSWVNFQYIKAVKVPADPKKRGNTIQYIQRPAQKSGGCGC